MSSSTQYKHNFCISERGPLPNPSKTNNIIAAIKSWLNWAAPILPLVLVLLVFVYPLGGYLMWKGNHFTKLVRWIITGLLIIWTLVLLSPSESYDPYGELGGSCAATFTQDGCTYYRDSDCNVVGQSCN